jgi:hypothetical protein
LHLVFVSHQHLSKHLGHLVAGAKNLLETLARVALGLYLHLLY